MTATPLRAVSDVRDGFAESRDGTRIHYYTVGEGSPTFVCCDGLGCDGYVWKYVVEDFSANHRIVRWHYRAHGTSANPVDRSHMRVTDLVDDLVAVLDANQVDQAVLLGHSLGVQVILEAAHQYPDRVIGLVPMCGSYGRPLDTFHDGKVLKYVHPLVARLVDRFPEQAQRLWGIVDSDFAFQVAIRTEVNGELVKRKDFRPYFTHLGHMDMQLFSNLMGEAGKHDAMSYLDTIKVPTLIISGERDKFTPAWLSQVMHARIKGSELCVVPSGSHTAPIEIPELVNLRLDRFMREHFATGSESGAAQRTG